MTVATAPTSYKGASTHYLSPDRRDPVKRFWEEPLNHDLLTTAIGQLDIDTGTPLRVLDIGAGTGDGVALLDHALHNGDGTAPPMNYVGLDPDPEMVATAQNLYSDRSDVDFVEGDVRHTLPVDDAHIYLSAGVPYSHLEPDEFYTALAGIFDTAHQRPHRTAVVIDVLGQYSLEWVQNWTFNRWNYQMSFFHGAGEDNDIAAPMTFYSRHSLHEAILQAKNDSGVGLASVDYYDRSVMVGRHTSTGTFNPSLPRYRTLINSLYKGDTELDLDELRLTPPGNERPNDDVSQFFDTFASLWNTRLHSTRRCEQHIGATSETRRRLANNLRSLEHGAQQGLGTAHSLIAVAITTPTR